MHLRVESFSICMDNPVAAYYSGQTVSGYVRLKLKEQLSLNGIYMRMEGKASVSWTEQQSYYDRNNSRRSDMHSYFDYHFPLLSVNESEENINLHPGEYEYPFSQVLPTDLPSSFEGSFGSIRYTCSSYVSIPWKINPKCKIAFTVLQLVDLNTLPGMNMPSGGQNKKTRGVCCWKSGSISASFLLNKQGYVPGENVDIQAQVNNSSDAPITRTTATLIRMTTYRADIHTKVEKKTICNVQHGSIQPRQKISWVDQSLVIPPIPPTHTNDTSTTSHIINWEYFLEFKTDPSKLLSSDLDCSVSVMIGSVPLVTDFGRFIRMTDVDYPDGPIGLLPPTFNYDPNQPSPMFKESLEGKVDIKEEDDEHTISDLSYVPRYLYYTQGQSK